MDIWDIFAAVSAALFLGGVAAIYWPAALILAGAFGLFAYYLKERTLVPRPTDARNADAE